MQHIPFYRAIQKKEIMKVENYKIHYKYNIIFSLFIAESSKHFFQSPFSYLLFLAIWSRKSKYLISFLNYLRPRRNKMTWSLSEILSTSEFNISIRNPIKI